MELLVLKGNLTEHNYNKFWEIHFLIEEYVIIQSGPNAYSVSLQKIPQINMHPDPDTSRKYNIITPNRISKEGKITPHLK